MKARSLALIAGSGAALMLGGPASARFLGITTETIQNNFGILTIRVYANFDNPGTDSMTAVAGTPYAPMFIQVVDGTFYQHPAGSDTAPNPALFNGFPSLRYDTFVTIGVESFNPQNPGVPEGRPADNLWLTPSWPGFGSSVFTSVNDGWAAKPGQPQGHPFDSVHCFPGDGRVLIGQYSTADGSAIQGAMLLQVRSDGVVEQPYVTFGGGLAVQFFVDADNCPGPGSGTQADPFCSIQSAISVAVYAGEIVVAPGTYHEAINFFGRTINLHSSGGPEVTFIDATGLGPVSVVTCDNAESPQTVLDGFTITGGTAPLGAGMYNNNDSCPTVINCHFIGNTGINGAGMYNGTGTYPTVTDCLFSNNFAAEFGGGMHNDTGSDAAVTNCVFTDNWADSFGGGMANITSSPTVTNCTFIGNYGVTGGGLGNYDNSPSVVDCTFIGNSGVTGGGMGNFNCSPSVVNCTFTANTVSGTAGAMYNVNSIPAVVNCIMWGDSPEELGDGDAAVSYSNVQGGWPGIGNFNADPWFLDPDNGDYRLGPGSPCIDAGDNTAVPSGIGQDLDANPRFVDAVNYDDTGNGVAPIVDMGAYEADEFMPAPLFSTNDILWRHNSGQTFVWLMDGTARIDQGPPGSAGSDWQIAGAGDFDGDGHADILWRNALTGQVFIWFMDGTQRVGEGSVGAVEQAWQIVGTGNFDGDPDGRSDILWRNTLTGQVFIWLLDGTQRIGQGVAGIAGPQWQIADVGDFDGDGRSDILWRDMSSAGEVVIWFIDGTERIDEGSAGSIGHEWRIVGCGNFDGDLIGRADILWRHDNGGVFIWLMNGTQRIGQGSPGSAGPDWQIVETGDLDGDGHTDILWRNQAPGGQVFAWFIDGTDLVGQGPLGSVPHDWKIVGTDTFGGDD